MTQTDYDNELASRLNVASVVMGNLPEEPGYNGSILKIDDEEAATIEKILSEAADRIAALVEERDAALRSRDEWSVTAERLLLEKQDAEAEVARLTADAKPVAVVHVGALDHGPFTFKETAFGADTLKDGLTELYARPAAPQEGDATEEMMEAGAKALLAGWPWLANHPEVKECGGIPDEPFAEVWKAMLAAAPSKEKS